MEEIEACIADQKNIEEEIEVRELACIIESFLDTLTIENRVIVSCIIKIPIIAEGSPQSCRGNFPIIAEFCLVFS